MHVRCATRQPSADEMHEEIPGFGPGSFGCISSQPTGLLGLDFCLQKYTARLLCAGGPVVLDPQDRTITHRAVFPGEIFNPTRRVLPKML